MLFLLRQAAFAGSLLALVSSFHCNLALELFDFSIIETFFPSSNVGTFLAERF
jgi:hypothetical protein